MLFHPVESFSLCWKRNPELSKDPQLMATSLHALQNLIFRRTHSPRGLLTLKQGLLTYMPASLREQRQIRCCEICNSSQQEPSRKTAKCKSAYWQLVRRLRALHDNKPRAERRYFYQGSSIVSQLVLGFNRWNHSKDHGC